MAAPVARLLFDVLSGAVPLPPAVEGGLITVVEVLAPETGEVRDC